MDDDLEFDEVIGADCYYCEHDSRYCYVHRSEAAMTKNAMDYWRFLTAERCRGMGDDIRTAQLAIQLREIGNYLDDMQAKTSRLIAAAEHDEKLLELRIRLARASGYAKYCWQEYALAEE